MKKLLFLLFIVVNLVNAQENELLNYTDVFEIEYANSPKISPNGKYIVYERKGFDIMTDKSTTNLWLIGFEAKTHTKLTDIEKNQTGAVWSSNSKKIAFTSKVEDEHVIFVFDLKKEKLKQIASLDSKPSNLCWSNDGKFIAYSKKVEEEAPKLINLPAKPEGAKWAEEAKIENRLIHETNGGGYIKPGYHHIFMVNSKGGEPKQLSSGNFHHKESLIWSPNGEFIYFSANRVKDWEYNHRNSEVYQLEISSKKITQLTTKIGPSNTIRVSPNGEQIAFIGFKDKVQTYQVKDLFVMNADGSEVKTISSSLDRSISDAYWSSNGNGFYVSYLDNGKTKIAFLSIEGKLTDIVDSVGGTSVGRPYASGSFSVSNSNKIAFTLGSTQNLSNVSLVSKANDIKILTELNKELLATKKIGKVEEVNYKSTFDGRNIQGWVVYPPDYNKNKNYPLLVENHGGPILNYTNNFALEIQLYAAKGYIVFYPNPRGSTSYGEEFGNYLYNNYPGEDYNDVMDGVDFLISKGIAQEDNLFVTGGSAGGIMTSWIIGKNNRFKAAVVAKPVVNWISKTLVADNHYGYAKYRYKGQPWENFEDYWKFSPLSLVGNIETPTMVMVGLKDLRTPRSEALQLYHALKLRKIETILVQIPDAHHGIASKPSNLISKVAHTLYWFNKYK